MWVAFRKIKKWYYQVLVVYTSVFCIQSRSQISSPHPLKLGVRKQTLKSSKRQGDFKFSTSYWGMGSWGGLKPTFPRWDLGIGAMRVSKAEDFEGNAGKKRGFHIWVMTGFPGGTSGKAQPCQCRRRKRLRFDPWVGKIPLEKEMAIHSSILAQRIPWTEEPGGLQSTGSQRVRQNWSNKCFIHSCYLYNQSFFPFTLVFSGELLFIIIF